MCPKRPLKGKRPARQSTPLPGPSVTTNDNDVSDEEVIPVCPNRKSKKLASGNGDVPSVKKP